MKITNKYNLPQALVDLASNSVYEPKANSYSATVLLKPVREIILNKRHYKEIEKDVSDMVNLVLGTATHSLIEKFDKTGFAEIFLKQEIKDGYYLTGKCDLYDEENSTLVDYKTATVWKIKFKDFEDWKKQGLIYAWLLTRDNKLVNELKFHAILKDWTAREKRLADLKGDFYPESAVYTWEYKVTTADLIYIEEFIKSKFDALLLAEKLTDDELEACSDVDCWYTGDAYAVMKNGRKTALRVLETREEAQDYMKNKGGDYIEHRKGEYRKCQDYCDVCKFCKYYEERKAE